MSDPRMALSFAGIEPKFATYFIDDSTITYSATASGGSAVVGRAVTLSATANTVKLAGDGEFVLGKLINVEHDDTCTVQYGGFMTLPGGSGATLTVGVAIVGDDDGGTPTHNDGYIRVAASGTAAELAVCRGFIQDATTTTAVVVYL